MAVEYEAFICLNSWIQFQTSDERRRLARLRYRARRWLKLQEQAKKSPGRMPGL